MAAASYPNRTTLALIAALGDFLPALESGAPFHPDFEDGLKVQRVLEAVETSARGNVVFVPVTQPG